MATTAEIAAKISQYIIDNVIKSITPAQLREILNDINTSKMSSLGDVNHNDLNGLNDGEYKHLTAEQLNSIVAILSNTSGTNTGDQDLSPYELLSNKASDFTIKNNTLYPSTLAVFNEINAQVAALVNSSPTTLDTLSELANALGNDPNYATSVATALGLRELLSNKASNFNVTNNPSLYPTIPAVVDYVQQAILNTSFTFYNNSGSTINRGDVVEISGYNPIEFSLTVKVLETVNNKTAIYVAKTDVPNNSYGSFIRYGFVTELTGLDYVFNIGDKVYWDIQTGSYINNQGVDSIFVGIVTYNIGSYGAIFVDLKDNENSSVSNNTLGQKVVKKTQINCLLSAQYVIFTTDSDKGRFVINRVFFHADSIVSLGISGPSISIGWQSPNYAEFVSNQALPNSSWSNNQFVEVALRSQGTSRLSAPPNTAIIVKPISTSNATEYTGTVIVEGYYIN